MRKTPRSASAECQPNARQTLRHRLYGRWGRGLVSALSSNVAALTSYLDSVTPIAALTSTQTNGKAPVVDNETGLTEDELAVCSATGISAEQFKAQKEA